MKCLLIRSNLGEIHVKSFSNLNVSPNVQTEPTPFPEFELLTLRDASLLGYAMNENFDPFIYFGSVVIIKKDPNGNVTTLDDEDIERLFAFFNFRRKDDRDQLQHRPTYQF